MILEGIDGVDSVTVSHVTKKATVTMTAKKSLTKKTLKAAFKKTKFGFSKLKAVKKKKKRGAASN